MSIVNCIGYILTKSFPGELKMTAIVPILRNRTKIAKLNFKNSRKSVL